MGKRKPFIVFLSFPMALVSSLLFAVVDAPMGIRIVYYLFMTMLYWTLFPMFYIPFVAWGAELTTDYDERTSLRSYAYIGNMLGLCVSTLFPTVMVDYLVGIGMKSGNAWHNAVSIVAVFIFASLFIGPMMIKEKSNALSPEEKENLKRLRRNRKEKQDGILHLLRDMFSEFARILKLKAVRYLLLASILFAAANSMFAADKMYYFTYYMEISGVRVTALFLTVAISGMLLVPLVNFSKKYLDKRIQFVTGLTACAAVMIFFRFIGVHSMPMAFLFMIAFGLGSMCYWQLMPNMIYDVCELDELTSGAKRQGALMSLQSIAESIADGSGALVLGFILEMAGFDEALPVQTQTALSWVENCFTVLPALLILLAVVMVLKYPITKKNHKKIVEALDRKKKGEEVDLAAFRSLL